jgi:Dna[CI] antecedent, DciA
MARRPRLDAPQQLGAVLLHATEARPPAHVDAPPVAPQDWELAVGTKIARRARPTRLERGVLHIRTATSTWAQELSLLADTIVQQLRARGLAVKSLRFHVGAVEPLKRPAWRSETRAAPEPSPLPADVRVVLAGVPDGDLRDAIARAAAVSLGYDRPRPAPAAAAAPQTKPATSPRSADPAPRSAASRSAPPDRKSPARRAAPRGSRAGSSGRGP